MGVGAKVRHIKLENGVWAWALIPSQYVQESFRDFQNYVKNNLGRRWNFTSPKQAPNPFSMGYATGFNATNVLDPSMESYYQSQIGVWIWMVDLGQLYINTEVFMLASCLDLPR